jgi:uncharacterized protein YjbI with pentapeptide repeats
MSINSKMKKILGEILASAAIAAIVNVGQRHAERVVAPVDAFEPPNYLTSLIAAVNDGAKSAQTGAFALGLLGLYLLAMAFSVTDEDILVNRVMPISQFGVQIPVFASFAMMPILFVALHIYTLIRYDMLAINARQFRVDLETMVPLEADRERCRQLLANAEFLQSITAPAGSALRSPLYGLMAWIIIAAFPVIVLLAVQINSLRYQSISINRVEQAVLLVDLGFVTWLYARQGCRILSVNARMWAGLVWGRCITLPLLLVAGNWLWLNVPEQNPRWGFSSYASLAVQPLDNYACPIVGWGCRYLQLDHRTLVGKIWDNKTIVELIGGQPLTVERRANFEPLFLHRRSLRFADLSESRLFAADMVGADLREANLQFTNLAGADLSGAHLTGARLASANLPKANLQWAQMEHADLNHVNLSHANLMNANLNHADLNHADLTGADLYLSGTNLSDSNLSYATLAGANVGRANLNQANLEFANFTDTNFSKGGLAQARLSNADLTRATFGQEGLMGAKMDSANLTDAQFFSSDLRDANLIGANLTRAKFNQTPMLGANLSSVNLTEATLSDVDLSGANLTGANMTKTVFHQVILSGADLSWVVLKDTSLDEACGDAKTKLPSGISSIRQCDPH